jgi:hypothetical protein
MTMRITTLIQTSTINILRLALLCTLVSATPLFADDFAQATPAKGDDRVHEHAVSAKLAQEVRDATRQFLDVNNAGPDYVPMFGCVTGPDHGAMGIHYINGKLLDGAIQVEYPEALIYEPVGNRRRLVGVEYIVDAGTWLAVPEHKNQPPQLDGQAFQFVGAPNRFAIPSFFELHVWAWRDNPQGAFVDWNNNVTCERQ